MSRVIKLLAAIVTIAVLLCSCCYLWNQDIFGFNKVQDELKSYEKMGYELGLMGKSNNVPTPQSWSKQQAFMDGLSRGYAEYEIKRLSEWEWRRRGYEAGLAGQDASEFPVGEFRNTFLAAYNEGHTEYLKLVLKKLETEGKK